MRSLLFVPADDERKLTKAVSSGADTLIIDLEDSVAPDRKAYARDLISQWIPNAAPSGPRLFVRINPLTSGHAAADLDAIMPARPNGIMQPKARSAADAVTLSALISRLEADIGLAGPETGLIVLITETAASLQAMTGYDAAGSRLSGLTWGAEDLSADIGASTIRNSDGTYRPVYELARALTLISATAAGVEAIDTVYPDYRNTEGFTTDCRKAVCDGFTAKMAIHPAQVPIINEIFTPSADEISRAEAIVALFSASETGVAALDGQMLDRPHLLKAKRLLARVATAD